MAGKIKKLIDYIIEQRSQGDSTIVNTTKTKMLLKGINPDLYNESSDDDPKIELRLKEIGKELGITFK